MFVLNARAGIKFESVETNICIGLKKSLQSLGNLQTIVTHDSGTRSSKSVIELLLLNRYYNHETEN